MQSVLVSGQCVVFVPTATANLQETEEDDIRGGSAPGADRTHNLRIRSPALCPLSYGGNVPDYTQKQKIKNKTPIQKAREILRIIGDMEIGPTFLEAIKKFITPVKFLYSGFC